MAASRPARAIVRSAGAACAQRSAAARAHDRRSRRIAHRRSTARSLLNFASNDYLGLAQHPALRAALVRGAAEWGVGATASHLLGGHRREHERLERKLAEWTGRERALLFSTGYMANLAVIATLLREGDVCVQDKLDHACLIDGARLAGCELKRYLHADVDSARRQLQSQPDRAALLATDGVFSMDGDIAPLPALAALCSEEGAIVVRRRCARPRRGRQRRRRQRSRRRLESNRCAASDGDVRQGARHVPARSSPAPPTSSMRWRNSRARISTRRRRRPRSRRRPARPSTSRASKRGAATSCTR